MSPKVLIYGRSSCAPCRTLLYWLVKKDITYSYVDCTDELPPADVHIFPTIIINDYDRIEGLNFQRLSALLT